MANLKTQLLDFQAVNDWLPGLLDFLVTQPWAREDDFRDEVENAVITYRGMLHVTGDGKLLPQERRFLAEFAYVAD